MVGALEERTDVRPRSKGLGAADRLAGALERFKTDADMSWASLDGAVVSAVLSERGRAYLREVMTTEPVETERTVSGRVVALMERGLVKIKTGTARNAPAFEVEVPTEDLLAMKLRLGLSVHFLVMAVDARDQLGEVHSTEYRFIRQLDPHEHLTL